MHNKQLYLQCLGKQILNLKITRAACLDNKINQIIRINPGKVSLPKEDYLVILGKLLEDYSGDLKWALNLVGYLMELLVQIKPYKPLHLDKRHKLNYSINSSLSRDNYPMLQ